MVKTNLSKILFSFIVAITLITSFVNVVQAYQYVRVEEKQLKTDFDKDGNYSPYFIKGIGYSPMPIGRTPSDSGYSDISDPRKDNIYDDPTMLDRDFALLQAMNVNTIRIWKGDDTQSLARVPNKLTQTTFDKAQEYHIKIIAGFWINREGVWQCGASGRVFKREIDFENSTVRADILNRFAAYVNAFKNHPALLFWSIGNENNLNFGDNPAKVKAFFSLVNEMAQLAKQIEGNDAHPVALVMGEIGQIGDANLGSTDAQMNHLDIWGSNVYRGNSFGNLFTDYKNRSQKPLWISEYGIDAWKATNPSNPSVGIEDQATQASYAAKLWDEIVANNTVTIGGTYFEYSDEWWKPSETFCATADQQSCNNTQNHFGFGPADTSCPADGQIDFTPAMPDQHFTEEWWGVVSIAKNSQAFGYDIVTPRQVYTTLKNKFVTNNAFPVLSAIGNKTTLDGQLVEFNVSATDPENGTNIKLTAELADGSALSTIGATFTDNKNGTGKFSWLALIGDKGNVIKVRISAIDAQGLVDDEVVTITIDGRAKITSPVDGTVLTNPTATFQWTTGIGVTGYNLWIGSTLGGRDIHDQAYTTTSATVSNLPINGKPLYVRLWSRIGISFVFFDYTYPTKVEGALPAEITKPVAGATLTTESVVFEWSAGEKVSEYRLLIGTTVGASNIFNQILTAKTVIVNNIPLTGNNIFVRLSSKINGVWVDVDTQYKTILPTPTPADLITPAPGGTINEPEITFSWSKGVAVSEYELYVGTTQAGSDVFKQRFAIGTTSAKVSNIPLTGKTLYVRLWSRLGINWSFKDYTYTTKEADHPAEIIKPVANSTLTTSSIKFEFDQGKGVTNFWLTIGTTQGGKDIFNKGLGVVADFTVTGIPLEGKPIYVQLWSFIGTKWFNKDYVYQTTTVIPAPAEIKTPAAGSTLTLKDVTFEWTPGIGVEKYWLNIGTSEGGTNIYSKLQGTNTSAVVINLPLNGNPLYVQLWSSIKGQWSSKSYVYQTKLPGTSAEITSPVGGSTLTNSTITFQWNTGSEVSEYWLSIGTSAGGVNLYNKSQGTSTSAMVSNLPQNGQPIYVQLWSKISGTWFNKNYVYQTQNVIAVPAEITTPVNGTILKTSSITFQWNTGVAVTEYWLNLGSSQGKTDLYNKSQGLNTSVAIPIKLTGQSIYVQLWSKINGVWLNKNYIYQTELVDNSAKIISPTTDVALSGTVTFQWSAAEGASQYWLNIGSLPGGTDIYTKSQGLNASVTISGIVWGGQDVYIQLWSKINGVWLSKNYVYKTAVP